MATLYSEVPENFETIKPYILTTFTEYKPYFENSNLVIFYDTCAIQHHSCLYKGYQKRICNYLKEKEGVVIITTCILMELAGDNHKLHSQVIEYFKILYENGIKIILFEESCVYRFLKEVFQSASRINEIFCYAIRVFNKPISTIRETINENPEFVELIKGKSSLENADLCTKFFKSVRANKQHKDNLGEQLIGICIYMLLHLVGEPTCKYTIITDDKGAASLIDRSVKSIPSDISDKRAGIFSSIKLFQCMYEENFITTQSEIEELIKAIYPSNVSVLALLEKSDLQANEYTFTAEDLAGLIFNQHNIRITF